jgi:hypothetical protein
MFFSLLGSLPLAALCCFGLLSSLSSLSSLGRHLFYCGVHVGWEQNIPQLPDHVASVCPSFLCPFFIPYLSILYMSS